MFAHEFFVCEIFLSDKKTIIKVYVDCSVTTTDYIKSLSSVVADSCQTIIAFVKIKIKYISDIVDWIRTDMQADRLLT